MNLNKYNFKLCLNLFFTSFIEWILTLVTALKPNRLIKTWEIHISSPNKPNILAKVEIRGKTREKWYVPDENTAIPTSYESVRLISNI